MQAAPAAAPPKPAPKAPPPEETERLICISCKTPMRVPNVRCPNPACGKVLKITPRPQKPPKPDQVSE